MRKLILYICLFLGIASQSLKSEENNLFIVCENSLEMIQWNLEFIRNASHSIEVSTCLSGGTTFRALARAIEKRLGECPELQVYFLTTPTLLEEEDKEILNRLLNNFTDQFHVQYTCTVLAIYPDITGIDNHIKLLIVDETYFSCGGTNLDQSFCSEGTYTPPRNTNKIPPLAASLPAGVRDQDVVGKGPLAKECRQAFHKLYALWKNFNKKQILEVDPEAFSEKSEYFSLEGRSVAHIEGFENSAHLIPVGSNNVKLFIGGAHQKTNCITQEYTRLIRDAKEEILIGNLYFSPVSSIFEALMDAVARGVKLKIISNGTGGRAPESTKYFSWATRINYVPMLYGRTYHLWDYLACAEHQVKNTQIYEYGVYDVLYHKKIIIVDGKRFALGSYNLGTRSDLSDYELFVTIESEEVAQEAKKVFYRDLEYSIEIMPGMAREWYFDPFIAYLGEVQKRFHSLI